MNLWGLFSELLTGNKVFLIDVGGYKGEFTDNFIENVDNVDDVFIYEPHQKSFNALTDKYSENKKITLTQAALGKVNGTDTFYFDDDAGYKSSLLPPIEDGFLKTKIRVSSLDEESRQFKGGLKCVLKADTQGNDLNVLMGGIEFIQNYRPIIFCELIYVPLYQGQAFAQDIISFLDELGYILVRLEDVHESKNGMLAYADGLFVHNSEYSPNTTSFELHKDEYCLNLENVCEERLTLINILDQECKRLKGLE